jgi:hypothetical protein
MIQSLTALHRDKNSLSLWERVRMRVLAKEQTHPMICEG